MEPPERTLAQRQAALRKAAESRRLRAAFRAQLRSGTLTPREGLEHALADEVLGNMRIAGFLSALPGWGPARTEEFMEDHGLTANRRLRGLGRHQIDLVRAALRS
ncbi:integration host factor, actinobacterial type [Corynebacterium variabile]|uniref:integration host factor, actinobacterial type n=1 Tax=Corynebacterium variabile TaxID=1727 RepID=UPI002652D3AB|nr:integration host factor [Corynebacterium variabile]MDN6814996.1 integration host factor [Corynebacterium variabile]